jgi:hypothetical protein
MYELVTFFLLFEREETEYEQIKKKNKQNRFLSTLLFTPLENGVVYLPTPR